jgi:Tfp pilus assembly protein PilO
MRALLRRIAEENRRVVVAVAGGLVLNVVLYVAVVYPMEARVRGTERRDESAVQQLQAAEREEAAARALEQGRKRTDAALQAFYKDVLPPSLAHARQATYLRLSQLAAQHNLQQTHRNTEPNVDKESSLARMRITMSLEGDYDDIRHFIHQLESGTDFIVIDSIAIRQGAEVGSALALDLNLSTYYQARPNGA